MIERNIPPEDIALLARAVQQLNGEADRPGTKKACLQVLADRLGWRWAVVKARVYVLRLRIVPAPFGRPKKSWEIRL